MNTPKQTVGTRHVLHATEPAIDDKTGAKIEGKFQRRSLRTGTELRIDRTEYVIGVSGELRRKYPKPPANKKERRRLRREAKEQNGSSSLKAAA